MRENGVFNGHKHKKSRTIRYFCTFAYAYIERITSENSTRLISGFVLIFLLMLMFMSRLFTLVLMLMVVLVHMLML